MNRFPHLLTTQLLCGYLTTCGAENGFAENGNSGLCSDIAPTLSFGLTQVSLHQDQWVTHE
jgi:hypothetical protein